MKKLIIGLLIFGSVSTFAANEHCSISVKYQAFGCIERSDVCNDVKQQDLDKINKILIKQGYSPKVSMDLYEPNADTKYVLTFSTGGLGGILDNSVAKLFEISDEGIVTLRATLSKTSYLRDGKMYRKLAKQIPHCQNL